MLINWLSLTAKFLNDKDEDWLHPMSPWPSDVNDEAANLHAYATTRRVVWMPLHKIPNDLPWHFLLPAQGDPNLWVVNVKVQCIIHKLYKGSHIVAWLQESPHFSTCPSLHAPWQWPLSLTYNHVSVFPPQDSRFCIHQRLTMQCHGCCPQLGNCILTVITGTLRRTLNFTVSLQPSLPWYPQGWVGALSPSVIPWWHWPRLWAQ